VRHKLVWMGLNRLNGAWNWIDNTPVDFTNYWPGEPNGDGQCVEFGYTTACRPPDYGDRWNDLPCGSLGNFITDLTYLSVKAHCLSTAQVLFVIFWLVIKL
jgi:hypothetical protein